MDIQEEFKIDLIPQQEPALSAKSDIPVVETKPDSQPAPEDKAKADAAPDEGKKPEESAPPENPDDPSASDEPKKAKGVQKRIDELVRQREDAERRAEAERQEKLRLLALVEKGKPEPKPEAEEDPSPQKPTRESFADDASYAQALDQYAEDKASWSARKAVKEALAEQEQKAEQRQREEAQKQTLEAYTTRVQKATEKYPDYKQVAESPDVSVSVPMAHAIMLSEHGPDIAYHLGKNPAEAKRISSLNPVQQLIELGKLEAKLSAPEVKADPPPQPQKPVSAAPKPIKPTVPSSEPAAKDPKDMSMDEYAEMARRRDAAARRAGART